MLPWPFARIHQKSHLGLDFFVRMFVSTKSVPFVDRGLFRFSVSFSISSSICMRQGIGLLHLILPQ